MTSVPQVRPEAIALPEAGIGERQLRRRQRRRVGRQQMLVIALMVLALVITVAVLAQQWLATGPSSGEISGMFRAGTGILVGT